MSNSIDRTLPNSPAALRTEMLDSGDLTNPRTAFLYRIHLLLENGADYQKLQTQSPLSDETLDELDVSLRAALATKA